MTVDIDEQLLFVLALYNRLFDIVDLTVLIFIWKSPLPVEVISRQRCPVVAINNPIGVEHREYLDDELVSHFLCFRM